MGMTGYIVLGILALVLLWAVATYNGLVSRLNMVAEGWSGIEAQLKRRADLIPNLVQTVQGAASFEKSTLVEITDARASVGKIQINNAPTDAAKLAEFGITEFAMDDPRQLVEDRQRSTRDRTTGRQRAAHRRALRRRGFHRPTATPHAPRRPSDWPTDEISSRPTSGSSSDTTSRPSRDQGRSSVRPWPPSSASSRDSFGSWSAWPSEAPCRTASSSAPRSDATACPRPAPWQHSHP